jgi:hypothetical protein
MHYRAGIQVPFFHQEISHVIRSAPDSRGINLPPSLHLQPRQNLRVGVLGAILELHLPYANSPPRFYMDDHVHLVGVLMRLGFRGHLSGIQTFLTKGVSQAFQPFTQNVPTKHLSERELHGCDGGRVTRRRQQTLDDHAVEEQLLSNHKINAYPAGHRRGHGAQVGIISAAVKRPQAQCNLRLLQRFSSLHEESSWRFHQHATVFANHAYLGHQHAVRRTGRGCFLAGRRGRRAWRPLRTRPRCSEQERQRDDTPQPIAPARFHASIRSDEG